MTALTSTQLSQRDCAQGGLVMAKSGRLELGDNILRTLYRVSQNWHHCFVRLNFTEY